MKALILGMIIFLSLRNGVASSSLLLTATDCNNKELKMCIMDTGFEDKKVTCPMKDGVCPDIETCLDSELRIQANISNYKMLSQNLTGECTGIALVKNGQKVECHNGSDNSPKNNKMHRSVYKIYSYPFNKMCNIAKLDYCVSDATNKIKAVEKYLKEHLVASNGVSSIRSRKKELKDAMEPVETKIGELRLVLTSRSSLEQSITELKKTITSEKLMLDEAYEAKKKIQAIDVETSDIQRRLDNMLKAVLIELEYWRARPLVGDVPDVIAMLESFESRLRGKEKKTDSTISVGFYLNDHILKAQTKLEEIEVKYTKKSKELESMETSESIHKKIATYENDKNNLKKVANKLEELESSYPDLLNKLQKCEDRNCNCSESEKPIITWSGSC